jgi:PKD repeat protein
MSIRYPSRPLGWRLAVASVATLGGLSVAGQASSALNCSISPTSAAITQGDSVAFSATAGGGTAPYIYSWAFGGGAPSVGTNKTSYAVVYPKAAGSPFTAKVTVQDRSRATCSRTAQVAVNAPPTAKVNGPFGALVEKVLQFSSAGSNDPDGSIASYAWSFGDGVGSTDPSPTHAYATAGVFTVTLTVTDDKGATATASTSAEIRDLEPLPNVSINSTSQDSVWQNLDQVAEQPKVVRGLTGASGTYQVLAINDLGMHCGDLDTRIASILPPFQVLLAQVVQKGGTTTTHLNPAGVEVYYSAASNPVDPALGQAPIGMKIDGSTYKTNFWDFPILGGAYDPFYPPGVTPLATGPLPVGADLGLPVPNVSDLYIGPDGVVDRPNGSHDGFLSAVQHAMPGMTDPYQANVPQEAKEHYVNKPFFVNFPFGYVANAVNWFEAAGIPFSAFDDYGRQNAYPLVRVQVTTDGSAPGATNVVATTDTVLPISGEASCTNCHAEPADFESVNAPATSRTSAPTQALLDAGLPVATSLEDPDSTMPPKVSIEYAADINVLRLHDLKHGANYVTPSGDGTAAATPCDITQNMGDGDDACLTYKAPKTSTAIRTTSGCGRRIPPAAQRRRPSSPATRPSRSPWSRLPSAVEPVPSPIPAREIPSSIGSARVTAASCARHAMAQPTPSGRTPTLTPTTTSPPTSCKGTLGC